MSEILRFLIPVTLLMSVGCGSSQKSSSSSSSPNTIQPLGKIEMIDRAKLYKNSVGAKLALLPIKLKDKEQFLISMEGFPGSTGKTIWLTDQKTTNHGTNIAYIAKRYGKEYWVLNIRTSDYGLQITGTAWSKDTQLAGLLEKQSLQKSEELVSTQESRNILNLFKEQYASGHISSMTQWNKEDYIAKQESIATTLLANVNKACSSSLSFSMDWDSFDDSLLEEQNIGNYCFDAIAYNMSNICQSLHVQKDNFSQINPIHCTVGKSPGFAKAESGVHWTPATTDQDEFTKIALVKTLGLQKRVAKSDDGQYIYVNNFIEEQKAKIYFGNKDTLHQHIVVLPFAGGKRFDLFYGKGVSKISLKKESWTLTCGNKETSYKELSFNETQNFLSKTKLADYQFTRKDLVLARDSRGVYYYVDQRLNELGGKDYKVYMGSKGALKETTLKDIVDDANGLIFSTKNGELRLQVDKNSRVFNNVRWHSKKKSTVLTILNPIQNQELIYYDLGIYDNQNLGTICD